MHIFIYVYICIYIHIVQAKVHRHTVRTRKRRGGGHGIYMYSTLFSFIKSCMYKNLSHMFTSIYVTHKRGGLGTVVFNTYNGAPYGGNHQFLPIQKYV